MPGRHVPILAALAVALVGWHAMAGDTEPAAADALFREGRADMKKKDYAAACPKFAESQRLDPAPGTLLNLAQCEEALGKTASAVQHYKDVSEILPRTDPRLTLARERQAALLPMVPRLIITLPSDVPAGTRVTRNGLELGRASMGIALPVDPGEHTVVVSAPGHGKTVLTARLAHGEWKTLRAAVGAVSAEEPDRPEGATGETAAPAGPQEPREPSTSSPQATIGYVVGGLGILGLGAGTYFAIDAKSKDDKALEYCSGTICSDPRGVDLTNESRSASKISNISFALGGLALVGGVVLVLTAPKESKPSTAVSVRGIATPLYSGIAVGGAW